MAWRRLLQAAFALTLVVVVLGAWVRLTDAGLGCPDWPGCYGALTVPEHAADTGKAWREMIHRYAAGSLGLLVLAIATLAWRRRGTPGQAVLTPMLLLGLVVFQSLLGMWTVTLLLKPVVVMGHLLGGLAVLSLLWWLLLRDGVLSAPAQRPVSGALRRMVIAGFVVVALQVALGGWTSANYAALACPDFPTCQAVWWPRMDFDEAFVMWRGLGIDYEGGVLDSAARTAIHMSHRLGALATFLLVGILALVLAKHGDKVLRRLGAVTGGLLLAQVLLGILTVLKGHPLTLAAAHNAGGALLLLSQVTAVYLTGPARRA